MPGPKMYIAYGALNTDDYSHGSTCLHIDLTCAVNIMLYANESRPGEPGGALWHIFKRQDTPKLRAYLIAKYGASSQASDPVHDQEWYLGPQDLACLASDGVVPFAIMQQPGQAVFIPSGCAHQGSQFA